MAGDFGVKKPDSYHRFGRAGCWALVIQPSTGAMYGSIDSCKSKARHDKLTCQRHDRFEAQAQKQKETSDV